MKAILAEVVGVIGGSHASERESQVPLVWFLRRPSPVARRPLPVARCPSPVARCPLPARGARRGIAHCPLPPNSTRSVSLTNCELPIASRGARCSRRYPRPQGGGRGASHGVLARGGGLPGVIGRFTGYYAGTVRVA